MQKSLLIIFSLFLGGCATQQAALPPKTVQLSGYQNAVSAAIAVPPVTVIPPKQNPPAGSGGNIAPEIIKEGGQVIEVLTNPPGARIEMNDKFLGVAPGKFALIRKPNRYGFLPRMTIAAIPPEGAKGQYRQTKVFDGYTETPDKISFDMSTPPPIPKLEGS